MLVDGVQLFLLVIGELKSFRDSAMVLGAVLTVAFLSFALFAARPLHLLRAFTFLAVRFCELSSDMLKFCVLFRAENLLHSSVKSFKCFLESSLFLFLTQFFVGVDAFGCFVEFGAGFAHSLGLFL